MSVDAYALHRDAKYWPNPDEFTPERWFEPKHHPYAYMPFGAGPRLCIGQRFALNEMQMCLAKMVHQFKFTLVPGFKMEYYKGNIALSPKTLMCYIKSRK